MNLAQASAINALTAVTNLLSGGTLRLYSGTQPATPETALSGNTNLATFTFASPAFGSASLTGGNEQMTASFSSASVAPSNNGTVTFARASMNAVAWASGGTLYSYGQIVTNSSNLYFCTKGGTAATSGGPTTQSASITDGTVQWQYIGAATATVVADFTVGTSGTDIIIGNAVLSTTINVTITSFILQIPAV